MSLFFAGLGVGIGLTLLYGFRYNRSRATAPVIEMAPELNRQRRRHNAAAGRRRH